MQNVGSAPPGPDIPESSSGSTDSPQPLNAAPYGASVPIPGTFRPYPGPPAFKPPQPRSRGPANPAPERPDANALESAIGGKLAVWVGAIALALGGVFLVKYSIDHGWLNETMRVVGGLVLGVGLGGAAWRLRDRSNYVAQGLAASGVIVVYASLWAATDYFDLIPAPIGLTGMVITTLAAVGLSLRLGPLVAVLGMLGAFLAPLLIGMRDPNPVGLFAYLLALQAGSQFVAYRRRWMWVSAISLTSGALWVLAQLLVSVHYGGTAIWPGLFLLGSTVVFVLPEMLKPSAGRGSVVTVWSATAVGTVLLALTLGVSGFDVWIWTFFVLLALGTGALAVWQKRYRYLPWMTVAIVGVLATIHVRGDIWDTASNLALLGLLASIFLGIGFAGLFRDKPREFYALAAAAPAVLLSASMPHLWHPVSDLFGSYGWMLVFLGIASVYAVLASVALALRRLDANGISSLLIPSQLFFAIAWPLGLDLHFCVMLWSVQLVALLALDRWLVLAPVRYTAVLMQTALNITLLTPVVLLLADDLGTTPLFHWASAAYLAAIAANVGARYLQPHREGMRTAMSFSVVLLLLAGAAVNIHHAANGGDLLAIQLSALEVSAHVTSFLLVSLWLVWRSPLPTERIDGEQRMLRELGAGLGLATLILGAALIATSGNPWLKHEAVSGLPVLNTLLLGIGLPALLAGLLSHLLGKRGYPLPRIAGWWTTGGLIVLGVMLQVRHAFHGAEMWEGKATHAEHYAYSISLALLALLALVLGIRRDSRQLRVVALLGMLACSAKVFGYDMRHVDGLPRVLSFLGLGGSLMLIGYLYNRFGPKPRAKSSSGDGLPPQETVVPDISRTDSVSL